MKPRSDEEMIEVLRQVEVPEPSPLFWDHLSQRVRDAVAEEPVPSVGWMRHFNLAWGGGIVAAVALVAVSLSVWREPAAVHPAVPGPGASQIASITATDPATTPSLADDATWTAMGALVSEMDIEEAGAAGLAVAPGDADDAFSQLPADEQQRAVELLQQEIRNAKSL
jgi:hypothetical protein